MTKPKDSAHGNAMLGLLASSPDLVLAFLDHATALASNDPQVVLAYALALSKTKSRAGEALPIWLHLVALRPNDVEVACAAADAALEAGALATAVQMLELCFEIDKTAATPAGRRARVLAVKLEKKL